jgi:hypothetical protein
MRFILILALGAFVCLVGCKAACDTAASSRQIEAEKEDYNRTLASIISMHDQLYVLVVLYNSYEKDEPMLNQETEAALKKNTAHPVTLPEALELLIVSVWNEREAAEEHARWLLIPPEYRSKWSSLSEHERKVLARQAEDRLAIALSSRPRQYSMWSSLYAKLQQIVESAEQAQ